MQRLLILALTLSVVLAPVVVAAERPPNLVVIFCDDLGYGDLGCYGAAGIATPNLDRLARDGMRFTSFCAAQAVCSASRAALLTGCYPNRVGIRGALGPNARVGIAAREQTLAELLRARGYATAIFGKWHLGDAPQFLPTRHGFDEYFGLPYSNDMWPQHPTSKSYPNLPLIEGEDVVALNPDQSRLTGWYTERAVRFIERNRERPFFLYVPHNMPHVPIFASEPFRGKSAQGLYGDVIEELDWSVGEILGALARNGLDERTLVIFATDNGPWLSYGNHAGSAGPLREGKGTAWDGGQRVPFIARWPGKIPPGRVCAELAATVDLLPTLAHLAGAPLPARPIDGKDIGPLLRGEPGAVSPHESFLFYWGRDLHAVRSGKWKLHFHHTYRSLAGEPGHDGLPGPYVEKETDLALFDLAADIGEQRDVAAAHPEVVKRLEALAEEAREDLGDAARKREGKGARPPGRLEDEPAKGGQQGSPEKPTEPKGKEGG